MASWQSEVEEDGPDLEDWERASANREFARLEYVPDLPENDPAMNTTRIIRRGDLHERGQVGSLADKQSIESQSSPPNEGPLRTLFSTPSSHTQTSTTSTRLVTPPSKVSRSLFPQNQEKNRKSPQSLIDERGMYMVNPYLISPGTRKRLRLQQETSTPSTADVAECEEAPRMKPAPSASTTEQYHRSGGSKVIRIKEEQLEDEEMYSVNNGTSILHQHQSESSSSSQPFRVKIEESPEEEQTNNTVGLLPRRLFDKEPSITGQSAATNSLLLNAVPTHRTTPPSSILPCTTASMVDPHTGLYKVNPYSRSKAREGADQVARRDQSIVHRKQDVTDA